MAPRWLALAATLSSVGAVGPLRVRLEPTVPVHDPADSSWLRGARADGAADLALTVALRVDADRREELERIFWEVSDPDHERYGQHLTLDEVTSVLAVPQTRVETVAAFFREHGALDVAAAPNRDMLTVRLSVSAAEAALNTSIYVFDHVEDAEVQILRAGAPYSLPAAIAAEVALVGELLQFPRLPPKSLRNLVGKGSWPNTCDSPRCEGLVTPSVLAQRYKLPKTSDAAEGNSMSVAEFQGQFFNKKDLGKFGESCHADVSVDKVIGKNMPMGGVEAELDIEYIKSVAPEVPLTVVYSNRYSLLAWVNEITGLDDPPLVHSVSYGNDEIQQTSTEYMYTCNTAFMKAGVRGLSILFASGDQGVCGRSGCGWRKTKFNPDFPAASPYITAVGGTDFLTDDIGPEKAWNAGGGGFSETFAAPAYQTEAVKAYFASPDADLPPATMWNSTGRGYPDVAALGGEKAPYCVNVNRMFAGVAGTSASSPVVAGVFAKLNGLRLAKGMKPLGFLNPFIYKNPQAFQDVEHGNNSAGTKYGFNAVKGWDAATGMGTPDFEALSKVALGDERVVVV